jgi:hypothetical protein
MSTTLREEDLENVILNFNDETSNNDEEYLLQYIIPLQDRPK